MSEKIEKDILEWRRYLHQNPELSYNEVNTSSFIKKELEKIGDFEIYSPTTTSLVAILKGGKRTESCKTLLFRADIDALPIHEETNLSFTSQNEGVMHACGHDAHAAMLLGACKKIQKIQSELSGEIRFVFQHAEEAFPGGAYELINQGVAEGVDYAFALHVSPDYESGNFSIQNGPFCAAADDFHIKIIGKGGHASSPDKSIDPIHIASQFNVAIQGIVSRIASPYEVPVISVTKIHAGNALNVIPGEISLGGTVRSHNNESRKLAHKSLERILKGVTESYGATYDIKWDIGYPAVQNDSTAVEITKGAVEKIFNTEQIIYNPNPTFGTEDFSSFSEAVPSSMQFIGVGQNNKADNYPLHHPKFNLNESALKYGSEYFYQVAKDVLS